MDDQKGLAIAIEEAKISYKEGGVPVSNTRCNRHPPYSKIRDR